MGGLVAWFLGTKIGQWLMAAGVLVLAIGGIFLRGYFKGKAVQKQKRLQDRLDGMKQRKESDEEIDSLGPADLDERYSKWLRDGDR